MNWINEKIIVSGGNGFLGRAVVDALIKKGAASIAVFCRGKSPELEKIGVELICGDIRDLNVLESACENRTMIFHCAAKAEIWGKREDFLSVNVKGTRNIISAACKNGVDVLVNTSSPSVVIPPHGVSGDDESLPYPEQYSADYPASKAEAERIVSMAASEKLRTISIRPHLIWGPGDPHILPRLIKKAIDGKLIQIGEGRNIVDLTYVENAAHAHILAAEKLRNSQELSGKKYFISDGEPVNLWKWIEQFLKECGIPNTKKKISVRTGNAIAWFCEFRNRLLNTDAEPKLTRFLVSQLAYDHYFDISAARRDLEYEPIIATENALRKTIEYFN